jgi:hypothetical protein
MPFLKLNNGKGIRIALDQSNPSDMDWTVLPDFYVEALTSNVIVLVVGFRR